MQSRPRCAHRYLVTNVDQITDLDTLRQIVRLQDVELERLQARLTEQTKQLAILQGKEPIEQLQLELTKLKEQVARQQRKLFGSSSERRRRKRRNQDKSPKERTQFGHRSQPDLPVETVQHTLSADEQDCTLCGGKREPNGSCVDAGEEITVVEREYKIVRQQLVVYDCQCPAEPVVAPAPVKTTPRGRYSLDFALSVAIDKYLHHLPLARQVRAMRMNGLIIDTQTLWDQLDALAKHLQKSYQLLRDYILGADVIGVDETSWRLMTKSSSKRWWVWAMTTHDGVFYHVAESRSVAAAKAFLAHYEGTVVCDAYSTYQSLAKQDLAFVLAHCWSHVRRKFIDAHVAYPDECDEVLDLIDELFLIERKLPNPVRLEGQAKLDALAQRSEVRDSESRAIIDRIAKWADKQVALPQSSLAKATRYMLNQWKPLLRFLEDPLVPIHNNHTEQEIRNWVLGRKNHYGSRSRRGTEVAAIFYTLIETARLCRINPRDYLRIAAETAIRRPHQATLPHHLLG